MKRIVRLCLLPIVAVLVSGCSGMSIEYDFDRAADFDRYETWQWLPADEEPRRSLVDQRIRTAIEKTLAAKGLNFTTGRRPDLLVTYQSYTRRRVDVTSYPYGYWRGGRYVSVQRYKEGTLVVDIVDPEANQLVWRGWAVGVVGRGSGSEERIHDAIVKILANFPPPRR